MLSLKLNLGPMFAGKSTELRRQMKVQSYGKRLVGTEYIPYKCILVNNNRDTRCGEGKMQTHDKIEESAIKIGCLEELEKHTDYIEADYVFIDEGQFFFEVTDELKKEISLFCYKETEQLIKNGACYQDIITSILDARDRWVHPSIVWLLKQKKHFIISGLDLTSEGKLFDIINLVKYADDYKKFTAKCHYTGKDAPFTKCIVEKKGSILIGGKKEYIPVSREYR